MRVLIFLVLLAGCAAQDVVYGHYDDFTGEDVGELEAWCSQFEGPGAIKVRRSDEEYIRETCQGRP